MKQISIVYSAQLVLRYEQNKEENDQLGIFPNRPQQGTYLELTVPHSTYFSLYVLKGKIWICWEYISLFRNMTGLVLFGKWHSTNLNSMRRTEGEKL